MRPGTTAETLGGLRPAFGKDGTITAGNASQISDGAAAVVVMSRAKAEQLGVAAAPGRDRRLRHGRRPRQHACSCSRPTRSAQRSPRATSRSRTSTVRDQRGVRRRRPGVDGRPRASATTSSTSTAAPSRSATRSACPAPAWRSRCSTSCAAAAAAPVRPRCAAAAARATPCCSTSEWPAAPSTSRRWSSRPPAASPAHRARAVGRLISLVEDASPALREVMALPRDAGRRRPGHRPDRLARRRQEHLDQRAGARPTAAAGCASACSPSTRARRSPAVRCSATASACRTTPPTTGCSSARWPPAATSAACPGRRRRRCACCRPRAATWCSSRRSASGRPRSTSPRWPTPRSCCSPPAWATRIQAAKAGILEVADVFVVNKADRDGADRVVQRPAPHAVARPAQPRAGQGRRRVGGARREDRRGPGRGRRRGRRPRRGARRVDGRARRARRRRRRRAADEVEAIALTALRDRMGDLRDGEALDRLAAQVVDGEPRPVRRRRPARRGGDGVRTV